MFRRGPQGPVDLGFGRTEAERRTWSVAACTPQKIKYGLVKVSTGPTRSGGPWFWADRSGAENMERSCMYPAKKIEYGLVKVSTGYMQLEKRVVWRCVKWPN